MPDRYAPITAALPSVAPRLIGWQRNSLTFAITLALLLGLLLPTTAVLVYDSQTTRATAMEDLRRDLARTTEVMSLSLAEPVWQVSPDLAEPMVKAQVDDPRFVAVRVIEPGATSPFLSFERRQDADTGALTLSQSRPILRDGREIAQLTVTMTAAPLLQAKQAEVWRTVWRSGLTLTLSLVLMLWVLQRYVLRPMTALTGAAEALAAGRLEQPLQVGGADEIARVGMAMERMRQALLSAFEALRQHNLNLEETVTQRTAELTASNAELSQALATLQTAQRELVESEKLASLGRLVAGVAHELNTPLGNALTVVSTLDDRYRQLEALLAGTVQLRRSTLEELARDTRRAQDILQRNVQKAADLVRDFKQVAIDQTADLRRDFELGKVVEDVLVMVEPSFKKTPYVIDTDLCQGLRMNSYPGALGQVLTNLLMNALLHGFDGREQGHVTVHCAALGSNEAELSVTDDGRGMDESVRRRIFDPFFTTKLGTGGSGLGMHIVHSIVTNVLGGQIEVKSSPGQGTQMLIRLPLVAPQRKGA
ncbi:sensor histidine kinase [Roseateles cellulosilyticus]|uniref:histidine kinase n=1 Tax=Pelomonas cellulosilytica TaxID=2906762 RepID=A0ABS8XXS4_9BURK|nr:HAMP domain-containing sensor histidine kinase [Pelomonas sp. P8]MCE4556627.1 HAMP domain-containing histidine kinase [Pelomonas sp. P8]